jgi:prepilin-type N-terminal cleavage/methylation domain-containing protein
MRKNLKAFTLLELIIVMALMTLLAAGIMRLFGPVRNAYQEATLVESKRNACNTINKYITESLRYAYYIGAYTSSETGEAASGAIDAANKLIEAIEDDPLNVGFSQDELDQIASHIQVITIDYNPHRYGIENYTGRIYSFKDLTYRPASGSSGGAGEVTAVRSEHMALGDSFYGKNSFGICAVYKNNTLSVRVSTTGLQNPAGANTDAGATITDSNAVITTSGGVKIQNIAVSGAKGKLYGTDTLTFNGTEDYKYDPASTPGLDGIPDMLQGNGTIASGGSKQYHFAYVNATDVPL